jgi:hypothetical protein
LKTTVINPPADSAGVVAYVGVVEVFDNPLVVVVADDGLSLWAAILALDALLLHDLLPLSHCNEYIYLSKSKFETLNVVNGRLIAFINNC